MMQILSSTLFSESQAIGTSPMTDALYEMTAIAKQRNPASEACVGAFENLPLRDASFAAAMAGFSIRDAQDLEDALLGVNRVLELGALLLIVDLAKPDTKIKRAFVGLYWRTFAPFIGLLVSGRLGLKFGMLSKTYERLPRFLDFKRILIGSGFKIVSCRLSMSNGVCIVLLEKPQLRQELVECS